VANLQDCSINAKPEVTYKTAVTPDRAYEFTDESLKWVPNIVQGEGLRAGSFTDRSARRVVPNGDGEGDITMEIVSKGFGYWWQACMGAGVSTLVAGSTQQQNFTWAKQPSSLTIQKASIRADGTVDPLTLKGCMVTQFVITFNNAGLVTLQVSFDIGDYDTVTAFAPLTYATSPNLFHFGQFSVATGAFTAPTTTALPSAATPLTGVRSLSITANRNPVDDRFNALATGRKDQPIGTKFDITGSMDIEYVSVAQRDAFLNQTAQSLVAKVEGGALSVGLEALVVALPEIKIDDGGVPETNDTGLIVQSLSFSALDNQTAAQPMWISTRTADTTI